MFDLQQLKVKSHSSHLFSSEEEKKQCFVGIRKNPNDGSLEFCLPKGFEEFPSGDFNEVKKLFFRTYKTYRKYFEAKKHLSNNHSLDGFSEFDRGYKLEIKDEDSVTYSKLNVFDSILDAYNELQILTLQNKLAKSSEIDYSRIDKYLHRGIYLEDDTVFIDSMDIPKKVIDLDSPTLVQMFCFIYNEIKLALEETIDSHRTKSLSQDFKEKYLSQDSSLFDQETFRQTLTTLKDTLDDIDKFTGYKDEDYWHFFQAIYTFLYGENEYDNLGDDTVWGCDNFAFIWEEMCYNYALKEEFSLNNILFADRYGRFTISNGFKNPFIIHLNGNYPRYLRPDLVIIDESPNEWKSIVRDYLDDMEENVDIDIEDIIDFTFYFLKEVFFVERIPIPNTEFVNLRLIPLNTGHSFIDIWDIYQEFVARNPKVIKEPYNAYFRNVADKHVNEFVNKILLKIAEYKTSHLINRKPFIFDFTIIDYKYVAEVLFKSQQLIDERKFDIKKQLVYEMALQSGYETIKTKSEFWIPGYFKFEQKGDVCIEVEHTNSLLTLNEITVMKLDFSYLQELYLVS